MADGYPITSTAKDSTGGITRKGESMLLDFNEVSAGMGEFADQPDIMAAWEKRDYVLLESLLQGLAAAITRTVMERLESPLENDNLKTFQKMAQRAALATVIAHSVASWHREAPMLGN